MIFIAEILKDNYLMIIRLEKEYSWLMDLLSSTFNDKIILYRNKSYSGADKYCIFFT